MANLALFNQYITNVKLRVVCNLLHFDALMFTWTDDQRLMENFDRFAYIEIIRITVPALTLRIVIVADGGNGFITLDSSYLVLFTQLNCQCFAARSHLTISFIGLTIIFYSNRLY